MPKLATATEIAARKSSAAEVPALHPNDRYNRALSLVERRVFSSVEDASAFVDLKHAHDHGVDIHPDSRRFFEESLALEKQVEKVEESRAAAVARQQQLVGLRRRRDFLEQALSNERAIADQIPSDMSAGMRADYEKFIGSPYGAHVRVQVVSDGFQYARLKEFILTAIIPELEQQLADANRKIAEFKTQLPSAAA